MQPTVQLQQGVEHGGQVGQVCPRILSGAMEEVLQVADQGDHGEDRLQEHSLVPGPLPAELEVLRSPFGALKACVRQGNRLPLKRSDHGQEDLIVDVGRLPAPGDHLPHGC